MATKFSSTSKVCIGSIFVCSINWSVIESVCVSVCLAVYVYLSLSLSQEINVSYEDQMRICQFARKNARLIDIQEQVSSKEVSLLITLCHTSNSVLKVIHVLQKELQNIEDAGDEVDAG